MSTHSGPDIQTNGLVFAYDMGNSQKSWRGAPASNRIFTTPLSLITYAYATGPVQTAVSDATFTSRAVNRYTISSAVNVARAAIYPPGGSLALSTPYAFSCIWKYNGTNTSAPSLVIDASKGNPETSGGNTFSAFTQTNIALGNGWTYSKLEFTLATSPTLGAYLTYGISTGGDSTYINNTFDVYNEQFEQNLYATPFVAGTRPNTQAILDLTGNNTITATSLTYNSDNTFKFVGSSTNIINLGNTVNAQFPHNSAWSMQLIFKIDAMVNTFPGILLKGNSVSAGVLLYYQADGTMYWKHNNSQVGLTSFFAIAGPVVALTITYTGSAMYFYKNGNLIQTIGAMASTESATDLLLGRGDEAGSSTIYSFQKYNRALSAAEVRQNFNALRGRFGI